MKLYIIALVFLLLAHFSYANDSCNYVINNSNVCNVSLSLDTDKENYTFGDSIKIFNLLNTTNYAYSIEYWVEDSYDNIIKDKINTSNTNIKSFTPNPNLPSYFYIKNRLANISCNNINNDTINSKRVFVYVEKDENPNLTLNSVSLGGRRTRAVLNSSISISFDAYMGHYQSVDINVSLGNFSFNHTILNGSYMDYSGKLYLLIPYDCNIKSGIYELSLNGFGISRYKNITMNSICTTSNDNTTITNSTEGNSSLNTGSSSFVSNMDSEDFNISESNINTYEDPSIFQNNNSTTKKGFNAIALYLFLAAVTLGLIVLWRNKNIFKVESKNDIHSKGNN